MGITRSSVHVSNPVQKLFQDLMFGTETIDKGVAQLIPGQRKQVTLNRFYSATQKLVARVPTPSTPASSLTKDERQITMGEVMWYDEFDPKEFNLDWKFLNTVGPSVSAQAASVLLSAIRDSVVTAFNYDLEQLLWNGDTGSADAWLSPIDGFMKQIDADVTVISAPPVGAITASNVIEIFESLVKACPAEVKELGSPVIVVNHATKHLYREAARALSYKGTNITDAIRDVFGGYPIVSVNGMPADRALMLNAGGNDRAELKVAAWADSDKFTVKIERLQANSDLFFIKINTEIGVNHVYGKQITEYSPA